MVKHLILALDGLSREELFWFSKFSPLLHKYCQTAVASNLTAELLCNTQTTWATLLTGKSWKEHHCVGYTKPILYLTEPQIVTEAHLGDIFLTRVDAERTGAINVPLLRPSARKWIADSASATNMTVSPASLAQRLPRITDRRSFHTPGNIRRNPIAVWRDAVRADAERIYAAGTLLDSNLELVLLRLSSFDVAGHFLFRELFDDSFVSKVDDLNLLGGALSELLQKMEEAEYSVVIISNYGFESCSRVVNINGLLAAGGYCRIALKSDSRRNSAAKELSGSEHSNRWHVLQTSQACSSTHGTVHINSKNRFRTGVVEDNEIAALRREILEYLPCAVHKRHGLGMLLNANTDPELPDLVFRVPGADYTFNQTLNSYDAPAAVHSPFGFLAVPKDRMLPLDDTINSVAGANLVGQLISGSAP
ncbi:MAG: alkaline phosphatase family protein [Candidatus Obscuribacterales bacterium]|nr:alkaline phosphatase family protein [Candidatus Obscuribacterales bacterium]